MTRPTSASLQETTPAPTPRPRRSRTTPSRPSTAAVLTGDVVAQRAYELFEARNREHGRDLDDWLQAEATGLCPSRARCRRSPKTKQLKRDDPLKAVENEWTSTGPPANPRPAVSEASSSERNVQ
jgi:hypothetical protein